jgi:hypothetical protein
MSIRAAMPRRQGWSSYLRVIVIIQLSEMNVNSEMSSSDANSELQPVLTMCIVATIAHLHHLRAGQASGSA